MKSDSFICETKSMHNACLSAEWFQRIVKIILSVHNMWGIQKQPSRGVFLGKGVLKDEANLQENTFKNTSEGLLQ